MSSMQSIGRAHDAVSASLGLRAGDGLTVRGYVIARLYGPDGRLLHEDAGKNIIPDVGLQAILENDLMATTVYVGLLANSPSLSAASTGATITLTDVPFSQSVRPTWTKSRTGQVVTNAASRARFDFTGAGTNGLGGCFLSLASSKTDAVAANLVAARAFTAGNLGAVANGYYLDVEYQVTLASS